MCYFKGARLCILECCCQPMSPRTLYLLQLFTEIMDSQKDGLWHIPPSWQENLLRFFLSRTPMYIYAYRHWLALDPYSPGSLPQVSFRRHRFTGQRTDDDNNKQATSPNHHVAPDKVKASVCHTDDQDFSSAEVTYRSECVTFCRVKKAITTAISSQRDIRRRTCISPWACPTRLSRGWYGMWVALQLTMRDDQDSCQIITRCMLGRYLTRAAGSEGQKQLTIKDPKFLFEMPFLMTSYTLWVREFSDSICHYFFSCSFAASTRSGVGHCDGPRA